jgi:voltage-gated potassium channel
MNIKKRLYLIMMSVFFVVMGGSAGYYLLFGGRHHFMDCVYMTVISLTTVGFGEVLEIRGNISAQVFTMVLIVFGMGVILYGISTLTAIIIEGELTGILRKKKMAKQIGKLKNHLIICGGGETGKPVLTELLASKENVVLIESNEERIEKCKAIGNILYIHGDATEDQELIAAGIKRAKGILVCLPSDKDNLYVTMTARMINPNVRIISRMTDKKLEPKLKKAGANGVVSPNAIGALRMASEMIRPEVVYFLDSMLRSGKGNIRIHQIQVTTQSAAVGKKISQSGLRDKYGLLILGARYGMEAIDFNPQASHIIKEGMTLIVMGEVENILKAQTAF